MGVYIAIPILAMAVILQATLIPQLSLSSGGPDLVFLLVVSWSINTDLRQGIAWAFAGGLLLDLLSALPVGTSSIPLLALIFIISGIGERFYSLTIVWMLAIAFAGTLFQQITMLILTAVLGYNINWIQDFTSIVIPTLIYNLVLIVPIYGLVRRMQRSFRV